MKQKNPFKSRFETIEKENREVDEFVKDDYLVDHKNTCLNVYYIIKEWIGLYGNYVDYNQLQNCYAGLSDAQVRNRRFLHINWKVFPNNGGTFLSDLITICHTDSNILQEVLLWLCNQASKVSAHLVIAKTGQVWQLVPFNRAAWHAGRSEYLGRPNVNSFSIGIENVGLGDEWPEAQIQANIDVIKALCEAYDIQDIVGHDEVCVPPGRKVDPGPLYPWKRIGDACGFEWEEV